MASPKKQRRAAKPPAPAKDTGSAKGQPAASKHDGASLAPRNKTDRSR